MMLLQTSCSLYVHTFGEARADTVPSRGGPPARRIGRFGRRDWRPDGGMQPLWDFLPTIKSLMVVSRRLTVPCASRPVEHSAVLTPSRTQRAGAPRRGRGAASRT